MATVNKAEKGPLSLGQSGAELHLVEYGRGRAIRKECSDQVLQNRLRRQFDKHQLALEHRSMEPILLPELLTEFSEGGYTMQYVQALTVGHLLEHGSRGQLLAVSEVIGEYFAHQKSASLLSNENEKVIVKLDGLTSIYKAMTDPISASLGLQTLEMLYRHFTQNETMSSWNHGDFSLENLLFQEETGRVYAVDLLDSPFDSILLDAGRLWMDLSHGWWGQGLRPSGTTSANALELKERVGKHFREVSISAEDLEAHSAFSALRILPYTLNPVRKAFLKTLLLRYTGGK